MGGSACLMASDAACSARPLLAASSTPAPCAARHHPGCAACCRSSLAAPRDRAGLMAAWRGAGARSGSPAMPCGPGTQRYTRCCGSSCRLCGSSCRAAWAAARSPAAHKSRIKSRTRSVRAAGARLARLLLVAAPDVAQERARAVPLRRVAQDGVQRVRIQRRHAWPAHAAALPPRRRGVGASRLPGPLPGRLHSRARERGVPEQSL